MSKLSPHFLTGASIKLIQAGSPIAVLVDGAYGLADSILAANPKCLLIGRMYDRGIDGDPVGNWQPQGIDPSAAARAWLNRHWARMDANPKIRYWIGPNEPVLGDDVNKAAWLAQFEATRAAELNSHNGLKAVIYNFSTGSPDTPGNRPDIWKALLPGFRAIQQYGGGYGRHAYGWPHVLSESTWFALRHRLEYSFLASYGLGNIPLYITECGIDPLVYYPGRPPGGGAFRDQEWRSAYGGADPDETYFRELKIFDVELQKDLYVKGATIFTFGNDGNWGGFAVDGTPCEDKLATYIKASGGTTVSDNKVKNYQDRSTQILKTPGGSGQHTSDGSHGVSLDNGLGGDWARVKQQPNGDWAVRVSDKLLFLQIDRVSIAGKSLWDSKEGEVGWVLDSRKDGPDRLIDTDNVPYPAIVVPPVVIAVGTNVKPTATVNVRDDNLNLIKQKGTGDTGKVIEGATFFVKDNTWRVKVQFSDIAGWVGVVNVVPAEPPPPPPPPVTNPVLSFEAGWVSVTGSIQRPNGWEQTYKRAGEVGFIPKKIQNGATVDAICLREPEARLLPSRFIPANEQIGQPRAIILDGDTTGKLAQGGAYSIFYKTHIDLPAGTPISVDVPVLMETNDTPTTGGLELDHWVAEVGLGNAVQRRNRAFMQGRKEIPNLERDWNVFHLEAIVPEGGIDLTLLFQSNWLPHPGGVDVFVDKITVTIGNPPPPPVKIIWSHLDFQAKDAITGQLALRAGLVDEV